jgi:hypothetical protein
MWTYGRRAEERVLVAECEAFFSGQYARSTWTARISASRTGRG